MSALFEVHGPNLISNCLRNPWIYNVPIQSIDFQGMAVDILFKHCIKKLQLLKQAIGIG